MPMKLCFAIEKLFEIQQVCLLDKQTFCLWQSFCLHGSRKSAPVGAPVAPGSCAKATVRTRAECGRTDCGLAVCSSDALSPAPAQAVSRRAPPAIVATGTPTATR